MRRVFFLGIISLMSNVLISQGWGEIQKIVPDDRFIGQQFGATVAMDGDYAIIGQYISNSSRYAYVFEKDGNDNWQQLQRLESPDFNQFDHFGTAVAISGDYILIGAWGEDTDANNSNFINGAGAAYVFKKQGSGLFTFQQKIVASDREALNHFGFIISIGGNYAAIGVVRQDFDENGNNFLDDAGAAYIFEKDGAGTWNEVQKIVPSDRETFDYFGRTGISINGDYLVVGASYEDEDESGVNSLSSAGSAYIFERNSNGTWQEIQKIVALDRVSGGFFGWSIDLDGDNLVVGASEDDDLKGSAYIFEKNSNNVWEESQKIMASDATNGDRFGQSVCIDGNQIIIGAYLKSFTDGGTTFPGGGRAYLFEKDVTDTWNQIQNISASDRGSSDYFGYSVAISGDFAIVGAYQEDEDELGLNFIQEAGSAYIFDANEPTLSILENDLSSIIDAYPNPTHGELTINLDRYYDLVNVTVYNNLGQRVLHNAYHAIRFIQMELDIPQGYYLIKVNSGNTNSVVKIIKQ